MPTDSIKENIKKQYARIAISGNSECCCSMPSECDSDGVLPTQSARSVGYQSEDLDLIPKTSILGVGCGAPLNFADIIAGEVVVDLGSGAGIDVFLAANRVGNRGKVIGIDMTEEMLEKAQRNASEHGYINVEFRKGDIEKRIPVDDDSADLVISNCVINLTTSKLAAFGEVYRILRKGGRMIISDLVTDREVRPEYVDADKWCSCIDGALTKENYLDSIRKAGFDDVKVLRETTYMEGEAVDGRRISSLVIRAMK